MCNKVIQSKNKIAISAILVAFVAVFAIMGFANKANAEEPKAPSNEPFIFSGVQIVGLNGETPSQGQDYVTSEKQSGGTSLSLNTPN